LQHPLQLGLSILGIALGVAVVIAVDLANSSARKSFELSMERVTGRATHRIVGGPQGVPEDFYRELRVTLGVREAAPVVSGYAALADEPGRQLQLVGVDLFAEAPFRDYLDGINDSDGDLSALLTEPGAALLPRGLNAGEPVTVKMGERRVELHAVGWLEGELFENFVIADISTAQALFDKRGRLSHIDLVIPGGEAGEALAAAIRTQLPPDLSLERPAERNKATEQMGDAFALNLTAMSLLALVVGMFLIYNAMTFSVVQRRNLLGLLRALGVSRREVFSVVLAEALLLGAVGTLLGGLLGIWLGSGLVHLVTRTINDLYYVLSIREFQIAPLSLIKGAVIGLLATAAAAWLPAREAAAAPPGAAMSRAQLEFRWQAVLPRLSILGLAVLGAGVLVLIFTGGLIAGFFGLFLLIVGAALLTPGALALLVRLNQGLTGRWAGLIARMATRDVARHLSRTGVAVAALSVAFATTVGVAVMVDSFRGGVTLWLNDLLNADVYIAPVEFEDGNTSIPLRPEVIAELRATSGVTGVSTYHYREIAFAKRPINLLALALADKAKQGYRIIDGEKNRAWQAFDREDAVIISEPFAYRFGLGAGSTLTLPTDQGLRDFSVAGVFLDYGSEHGRVLMNRVTYDRFWKDDVINSAAAYLAPGVDVEKLRRHLESTIGRMQPLSMRSNRHIVEASLEIFERTFTITNVLRLLAIAVAFVGMLSALMAMQLERAREFAVLRANGMTPGQIGWLVSLQTTFMGFVAGLLSIPLGLALAGVLIFEVNRRAFGWTLPYSVDYWILAQAMVLAVVAAALAGVYPIWRMARSQPAAALRAE
jgi:putative ABC transport system permease protein